MKLWCVLTILSPHTSDRYPQAYNFSSSVSVCPICCPSLGSLAMSFMPNSWFRIKGVEGKQWFAKFCSSGRVMGRVCAKVSGSRGTLVAKIILTLYAVSLVSIQMSIRENGTHFPCCSRPAQSSSRVSFPLRVEDTSPSQSPENPSFAFTNILYIVTYSISLITFWDLTIQLPQSWWGQIRAARLWQKS